MTSDDREKIAREIAKTSESIRKKYRSLKTGQMEEDVALERHFKPITEPLKQLVENTINVESNEAKIEPMSMLEEKYEKKESKYGTKRSRSNISFNDSPITPNQSKRKRIKQLSNVATSTPIQDVVQPSQILHERSSPSVGERSSPPVDEIFETTPETLVTSVQHLLQTSEGQNTLRDHFGPLGQKYVGAILSQDKNTKMDYVYGVKFCNEGMMIGNKFFDVDKDDNIYIDGIKYVGTPGLYELIFMRMPDDAVYTEADMYKYKNILLATNAHKRDGNKYMPVLSNRGYKYKFIIAPLISGKKAGRGINIPRAMTLNDNKIDYVHWNDPNELVDRLRLLEASRQAGNNAHDNEILSIIEELREAGLIIN